MTTPYIHVPRKMSIDPPHGGIVRSGSTDVYAPGQLSATESGVSFGPLYVGVPDGELITLNRVSFLSSKDEGGFLGFLSAGAIASVSATKSEGDSEDKPTTVTRRNVLGAFAAAVALGVSSRTVAADQDVTLGIAEIDVAETTGPVSIRLLDIVDNVLPPTTEVLVDADSARVGEIVNAGDGVTLGSDTFGPVSIYLRDSRSRVDRILAWAGSFVDPEDEITYHREFPDGKQANEYDDGQFVTLTEHPSIIGAVEGSTERTRVIIGNTDIPHTDSDQNSEEVGTWGIFDNQLVYEPGSNPPASSEIEIRMRIGRLEALLND